MFTTESRKFKLQPKAARPILAKDLARDIGYLKHEDLVGPRDKKIQKVIREYGSSRTFEISDQIYPLDPHEPAVLLMQRGAANLDLPSQPIPTFVKRIEQGFIFGECPSIGLLMLGTTAEAVTPSEVVILGQPALKQIATNTPEIALRFFHILAPRFSACQIECKRNKFGTLLSKFVSLLLELADDRGFVVGITERAIAESLATRRESVVALIAEMKRTGLLKVIGKQKFLLTDIAALRALELF
jgi:CRP-like cAMP-binding protein